MDIDELSGKMSQRLYDWNRDACIHRTSELACKMMKTGLVPGKDFTIQSGTYRFSPHVWIEKDGKIVDPTVTLTAREFYKPYRPITIWELKRKIAQR